ncbi:porin [Thioclava sp. NG1]|uniref:porin n=1 Tax=Thioclava sp. NG1 TaxID=2182426 RepID=UPI000D61FB44|nr:porin [Thioclava sp. NG1]PWE48910.1 porin [Thioclava sp. NG1]
MKKVLFATTALVFSAGIAAAEVSVGGDGRMGVVYNGSDWNFSSRVRVSFTASGTTDGGLEFGGSIRADNAGGGAAGTAGSVYISGAFGKLSMGDVVGASEALFGDFYEVGYTDLSSQNTIPGSGTGFSNDILYLTGDNGGNVGSSITPITGTGTTATGIAVANTGPNLLYTGTFGAFSVAASMSDGKAGSVSENQEYAVAGAYTFGNYTVGLGYEYLDGTGATWTAAGFSGKADMITLAGVAQFGNTSVKAGVAHIGKDLDADWYGIGASSVFGATTVGGYVQHIEDNNANMDVTWYGLGAEYDLGGGASIKGGVADNDLSGSDMVADLGVKFSF